MLLLLLTISHVLLAGGGYAAHQPSYQQKLPSYLNVPGLLTFSSGPQEDYSSGAQELPHVPLTGISMQPQPLPNVPGLLTLTNGPQHQSYPPGMSQQPQPLPNVPGLLSLTNGPQHQSYPQEAVSSYPEALPYVPGLLQVSGGQRLSRKQKDSQVLPYVPGLLDLTNGQSNANPLPYVPGLMGVSAMPKGSLSLRGMPEGFEPNLQQANSYGYPLDQQYTSETLGDPNVMTKYPSLDYSSPLLGNSYNPSTLESQNYPYGYGSGLMDASSSVSPYAAVPSSSYAASPYPYAASSPYAAVPSSPTADQGNLYNYSPYMEQPASGVSKNKKEDLRPMPDLWRLANSNSLKMDLADLYGAKVANVYLPKSQLPPDVPKSKNNHIFIEHHHRIEYENKDYKRKGEKALVGCFPGNYVLNPDKTRYLEETMVMPFPAMVPEHLRFLKCVYVSSKYSGADKPSKPQKQVLEPSSSYWKPDKNARGDFSEIYGTEKPVKSEEGAAGNSTKSDLPSESSKNKSIKTTPRPKVKKVAASTPLPKVMKADASTPESNVKKVAASTLKPRKRATLKPETSKPKKVKKTKPKRTKSSTTKPGKQQFGKMDTNAETPVKKIRPTSRPVKRRQPATPKPGKKSKKTSTAKPKKRRRTKKKPPLRQTEQPPTDLLMKTLRKIMATTPRGMNKHLVWDDDASERKTSKPPKGNARRTHKRKQRRWKSKSNTKIIGKKP